MTARTPVARWHIVLAEQSLIAVAAGQDSDFATAAGHVLGTLVGADPPSAQRSATLAALHALIDSAVARADRIRPPVDVLLGEAQR